MNSAEYRIYSDSTAWTADDLERLETITVEQEVDHPWQARLEITVCLNSQGQWSEEDATFFRILSRIRIELKVGDGDFVPLIDGPIVGSSSKRSSRPGESVVTIEVRDDSAFLNRKGGVENFPAGSSDSDIAEMIFGDYSQISSTKIEPLPASPNPLPPEIMRRGSHMELLRELAHRNDLHAAVLPGTERGKSIGVFYSLQVYDDQPPALVLLGSDRNIESFDVKLNSERPTNFVASTLSFSDKNLVTREASVQNLELMEQESVTQSDSDVATQRLRPGSGEDVDLQHRVDRETRRSSRAIEATGSVKQCSYGGILLPFRPITVKLGTTPSSGTYLIQKVVHRLGRSDYAQDFTVVRDSEASIDAGGSLIPAELF